MTREQLGAMRQAIHHRGPDDEGTLVDAPANLGFAHARLSIIDLSAAGHQPMQTADGALSLVYNGEIYNFRELRRELERSGCSFRSHTDTEVLLQAWRAWGPECLPRLNGMFAFAVWDARARQLHLARDRVGVKPLFYAWNGRRLAFASELKVLFRLEDERWQVDRTALSHYLQLGYVPAPWCILEGVFKVAPGQHVCFDLAEEPSAHWNSWWRLPPAAPHRATRPGAADVDELIDLLKSAFQYRLIADVPVGVFLSGGVDSSLVAAVLAKECGVALQTFTIGFSERSYDESAWARRVAERLGTDHHEMVCGPDDARRMVPSLARVFDEPLGDSSTIPTMLVARFASEHVKVALSADGGDELFGGYRHHAREVWLDRLWQLPGARASARALAALASRGVGESLAVGALEAVGVGAATDRLRKLTRVLGGPNDAESHLGWLTYWGVEEIERLLGVAPPTLPGVFPMGGDVLDRGLRMDFSWALPEDMLAKMDRACMAVSLENREPMLDYRIVEQAFAFPSSWKVAGGRTKVLLKTALERYLPPEWVHRKKQGFVIPLQEWCRDELAELYSDHLGPEAIRRSGVFEPATVQPLVEDYLRTGRAYAHKMWALLMFQMWWDEWMRR